MLDITYLRNKLRHEVKQRQIRRVRYIILKLTSSREIKIKIH